MTKTQKIIHSDCFTVDYNTMLNGRKIDLLVMDPPYLTTDLKMDKDGFDLVKFMDIIDPYLADNTRIFMFGSIEMSFKILQSPRYNFEFEYVWIKPGAVFGHPTPRPGQAHEKIYVFSSSRLQKRWDLFFDKSAIRTESSPKRDRRRNVRSGYQKQTRTGFDAANNNTIREGTTVLHADNKSAMQLHERTDHPTQKPLSLYDTIIRGYCPIGGLVLDPTAGSCGVAVVADKTGRDYICIEKEQEYVDIGKSRIPKHVIEEWGRT